MYKIWVSRYASIKLSGYGFLNITANKIKNQEKLILHLLHLPLFRITETFFGNRTVKAIHSEDGKSNKRIHQKYH